MSPEITIFIAKAATDKRVWIAVIATVCALLFCLASCSAFSISSLVAFSTYPSEPDDLLAVEAAYSELETQHIESLKNSEQTKPGYDEYQYITDAAGHDAHVLASYLSVVVGKYNIQSVSNILPSLVARQYTASYTEQEEIRERVVGYEPDSEDPSKLIPVIEEYTARILVTTLTNNCLNFIRGDIPEDAQEQYDIYFYFKGNYPDLFGDSLTIPDYSTGEFIWPLPGYTTISSPFGSKRFINGKWDVHRGIDIPAPEGTPIYAAATGIVSTKAHWSYGTCVKISHTESMVTIYGHMVARAPGITDGVVVTKGQLIGYVGSTGNSTGYHLHFEVDINGINTDPALFIENFPT